jgi:hypothetical protein
MNTNSKGDLIETLRMIINEQQNKNYTREELGSLFALSELMVDIACGEFVCKSCREKYKIYGINSKS